MTRTLTTRPLNRTCRRLLPALTCALIFTAFAAAPAQAASACRPIDDLPYVIGEPGLYCLTRDFAVDLPGGAAIEVQADHVTIDLAGFTLDNRAAGRESSAAGIFSWERANIVVRDGSVIGFHEGIALSGPFGGNSSYNHRVENVRVAESRETGIGITGDSSVVRGCTVYGTGDGSNGEEPTSGIFLGGWRNRAIDNDVVRVVGHPESNVAIRFVHGGSHMAVGNRISSARTAILFPGSSAGFYRDNLANEIPCCDAFVGGKDLGGNVWQ